MACAKLYDRKTPITAADMLNDRVVPFFDSQEVKLLRVLTDRGSEYCGNPERHEYELYLAIANDRYLRATDLLQRQLAARVVKLLEAIKAIAAIAHHLAGWLTLPSCLRAPADQLSRG